MTPNYKLANKRNYRFDNRRGKLTTEELFNLPVEELDEMAQTLNKSIKAAAGNDSFIPGKVTKQNTADKNKLAILIDIINTKVDDENSRKERNAKSAQLSHLRELLADKMDDETRQKSAEELKAMIAELEEDE